MSRPITEKLFDFSANSVSLVFSLHDDYAAFAYFGTKVANPSDASILKPPSEIYGSAFHEPTQSTYPPFGGDAVNGMDAYGAFSCKHSNGDTTTQWKLVSAEEFSEGNGVRRAVFEYADKAYRLHARQHFRLYADCDVFETWVELVNDEEGAVEIFKMSSFALELLGRGRDAHLLSLTGQWGAEAQCSEATIGRGQTVSLNSRSGIHGSWENNQAFMVALGAADETSGDVFGGALAWTGPWASHVYRSQKDMLSIHSGVENCGGSYILDSGKTITLPTFIFTFSGHGKGQVSRNLHKWAREYRMPRGRQLRPVLLNSWEGAYMNFTEKTLTDMMDGVKEFGGEMFVVDDGWFGIGEFARNTDKTGLGDWKWNHEKLPRGVKYLADEANARGLQFGLWFEPEMANTRSETATKHPDWILRDANRPLRCGRGGTQVVLDMSNPAVRDYIFEQINTILKEAPNLTYIKWDANADFTNVGSAYLPADRQGNIWFDYTRGVYDLFERLCKAHPHVMFQACSSGGGHADYGFLKYADEFWGSDNTDARQRIFIQWGEMLFYPANSVACHVTASPNHQTGRQTPLKYRFDVAMSGRLGFELRPEEIGTSEIQFVKKAVETYKTIRPIVQQGDLYRIASPYENDFASISYVMADKSHATLFVWGLNRLINTNPPPPFKLQGLDPSKRYRITEINTLDGATHSGCDGQRVGGDALMTLGIPVSIGPEYDSAVFYLVEEQDSTGAND